jgi:hypothetical protein
MVSISNSNSNLTYPARQTLNSLSHSFSLEVVVPNTCSTSTYVKLSRMPQFFNHSFLQTQSQSCQKLVSYAQLYATYTNFIQQQGDTMCHDMLKMEQAYHEVAAEFSAEQNTFVQNKLGASYILADLNKYARRCDVCPQTFQE